MFELEFFSVRYAIRFGELMGGLDDLLVFISFKSVLRSFPSSPFFARLQKSHPASRQEPHSLIFVTTVNDIDVVARHRVMKGGTRIFGDKAEEGFPPRVFGVRKISSPIFLSSSVSTVRIDFAIALRRSFVRASRSNFSNGICLLNDCCHRRRVAIYLPVSSPPGYWTLVLFRIGGGCGN